ncbi:MAG: hypothetical protein HY738_00210 [Bacteroidia bacterium]|nr:hypothetical protein [Bacteroidia bacterium]
MQILDFIGYLLTMGVAVFLIINKNIKSKWYSLIIVGILALYGLIIANYYISGINTALILINIIIILKIHRKKEYFRLFEVDTTSKYLKAFLEYYYKEINRTVPYYSYNPDENTKTYVLLRNMAVVGVFIAKKKNNQTLLIDLDFVIPEYRDFRMGKHIYFHNQKYFYDQGFRQFHIISLSKEYDNYLLKMGFREDTSTGERIFVRNIQL